MTENTQENYIQAYKVVILGESAVGKSSIAQRYVNGEFTGLYQPTLGALFLTKKIMIEDRIIKLEIWDTAGQERFHSLTPLYYKNAKVAIVVFDITNNASFDRAKKWVEEIIEKANVGILICICGNKNDLKDKREVKTEDAQKYAEEIGSFYIEVSAKTNNNIDEMFNQIVEKLPKIIMEEDDKKIVLGEENSNNESNYSLCGGYCNVRSK